MLRIILLIFIIITLLIGLQFVRVYFCTKGENYNLQPWQQIKPGADFKVLFAGDSTAVGTGLSDNSYSTAGLFSKDFPDADVENHSQNGLRLKGLADILETLQDKKFDLAVLQIGANDIINLTPMAQIKDDQRRVLDLTKHIASKIIILHSGAIGEAPLFIWPFNQILTWRSLRVRDIYLASQDDRVSYVDVYTLNKSADLSDIYAKDNLHLNPKGYGLWYSYIKNQLRKLNWLPTGSSVSIRYVALGDSYTIGTGARQGESWPEQVTRRLKAQGVDIKLIGNFARNGWTTQNVLDSEIPDLRKLSANYVTLLIGTNDWVQGMEAQTFQNNLQAIFRELTAIIPDHHNILVVTVPDFSVVPAGKFYSGGRDISQGLAAFNQIIKAEASAFGLRVIDIFPLSQTLGSLASSDGLHPSAQGYSRWADLIEPAFPRK